MEQSDKEMLIKPLASIRPNGILGFRIGDETEEVFSRIRALGLLSDEEIKKEIRTVNVGIDNSESNVIVVGQGMFMDVSSIYLSVNRIGLNSIIVNIKRLLVVTPQQQLKQLSDLLSLITGKMPMSIFNMYTWNLDSHNIVLSYGTDFDVTDEICLSFDKN